jgi:putative DNA primase/helicase
MVATTNDASRSAGRPLLPSYEELTARSDFDWLAVLEDAGAGAYLSGKNGPCPFCGGTDRFQFSRKKMAWFCRACPQKGGPASDFLSKFLGYTAFAQRADHIRRFYGIVPGHAPAVPRPARLPEPKNEGLDREACISRIVRIWDGTRNVTAGDPVELYLRGRLPGLGAIPSEIRLHPSLKYWERGAGPQEPAICRGAFPAMIMRGFDADGNVVQVHKTYLTAAGTKAPVESPKKTEIGVGSNRFAVRLGMPSGDTLGVCEGIETALAASILDGIVVWPCHSSSILANFVLPTELRGQIKRLVIYADSDPVKAGRKAGSEAAAQLAQRSKQERLRTLIVRPAKIGHDMADLVRTACS